MFCILMKNNVIMQIRTVFKIIHITTKEIRVVGTSETVWEALL